MCGEMISQTAHTARKSHRCEACDVPIPAGFGYIRVVERGDGGIESSRWHMECREEFESWLRREGEDCGDPWSTWEDGMPDEIKQRYVHGPIFADHMGIEK